MQKFLSILLIFTLVLPMTVFAQNKRAQRQNRKSAVKCPDFGKPVKLAKTPRTRYRKKKKKKPKYKVNKVLCSETLTDEMNRLDEKLQKLQDKIEKETKSVYKKHDRIGARKRRISKRKGKKTKWKFRIHKCYKYKSHRKGLCLFEDDGNKKLSDRRRDNMNEKADSSFEKSMEALLNENFDELKSEFEGFMSKHHPEVKFPEDDVAIFKLMFNEKKAKDPKTNKSFFESYAYKQMPDVYEWKNEVENIEAQIKELIKQQRHVCNKDRDNLNSCPDVKSAFTHNPTVENFEQMIKTIGGLKYSETDNADDELYVVVTTDNYKQFKKISKSKKFYSSEKQVSRIKSKHAKAQKAYENYLENIENADNPKYEPKPVNSVCGSCRDVRVMYNQAKANGSISQLQKIIELDQALHCKVTRETPDCAKQVHGILSQHRFNYYEDQDILDDNKKYISLDMAFSSLEKNPKNKKDQFTSAFEQINKLINISEEGAKSCGDCGSLTQKLDDLGSMQRDEHPTIIDGENVYQEYFQLAQGNEEKKDYFNALRSTALKLNCIEPDDYKEKPEDSCESRSKYFSDLVNTVDDLDSLDYDQQLTFEQKLADLKMYQEKNNTNCCEKVIGDLTEGRALKKETKVVNNETITSKSYIEKGDKKLQLAEAIECMKCGGDRTPEKIALYDKAQGIHTNCKFYKNVLSKLNDSNKIPGLKKPDGTYYTAQEYKQNEIYTCKDGPKQSLISPTRDWETIAYSEHGKYGDLAELDMKCYINPTSGESVNLTCCNLTDDDPHFKDLVAKLEQSPLSADDFNSDVFTNSKAIEKMNNQSGNQKARSFCKDIFSKYQKAIVETKTAGWNICVDYLGNEIWRVNSQTDVEIDENSGTHVGTPGSKGTSR